MRENFSRNLALAIVDNDSNTIDNSAREELLPVPISGLTPLTTIDFPGHLSCVLFLQGCPWRCGYCHNSQLWPFQPQGEYSSEDVYGFLTRRSGLLEAVVFSGGEPTAHKGLSKAIKETKAMGFKIGLHTGGAFPSAFEQVLPLVDWVGFDWKAPLSEYDRVTGKKGSALVVAESLRLLLQSQVPHEFRSTIDPEVLSGEQVLKMAEELRELGGGNLVLQEYQERERNFGSLTGDRSRKKHNPVCDSIIIESVRQHFSNLQLRR